MNSLFFKESYENPLKPVSAGKSFGMITGASLFVLGWWALERFTEFSLMTKWQAVGRAASETAVGASSNGEGETADSILWFIPVVVIGLLLQTRSRQRLANYGRRTKAKVLHAKTLKGVRVVKLSFQWDGEEKTTKSDIWGSWGADVAANDELDVLHLPGFLGGTHVLGRSRQG